MTTTLAPAPYAHLITLTEFQRRVLGALDSHAPDHGGGVFVREIMQTLDCPRATVADALERLLPRGYVETVPDPDGVDGNKPRRWRVQAWVTARDDTPIVAEVHSLILSTLRRLPAHRCTLRGIAHESCRNQDTVRRALDALLAAGLVATTDGRTYRLCCERWISETAARLQGAPTVRRRVFGECANCTCPSQPWEYQTGTVTLPDGRRIESATIRTAPCRRDQVAVRELLEGLE